MAEKLSKSQQLRARSQAIGRAIKAVRKERGLFQEQLGELLGGVSKVSVSRAERGGQNFTINALYQYAEALGVSVLSLLPTEQEDQAGD